MNFLKHASIKHIPSVHLCQKLCKVQGTQWCSSQTWSHPLRSYGLSGLLTTRVLNPSYSPELLSQSTFSPAGHKEFPTFKSILDIFQLYSFWQLHEYLGLICISGCKWDGASLHMLTNISSPLCELISSLCPYFYWFPAFFLLIYRFSLNTLETNLSLVVCLKNVFSLGCLSGSVA